MENATLAESGLSFTPRRLPLIQNTAHKEPTWAKLGFEPGPVMLNLACGPDYRPGWVNVDYYDPGADLCHDLRRFPWPFESDHVDSITVEHYIEHLPFGEERDLLDETFREIHRVLKPGGRVLVATPYAGTRNDYWNHKHTRSFIPQTLGFLWRGKGHEPTSTEYGGPFFELGGWLVRRNIHVGKFESFYHVPKWLGFNLDWLGWRHEIVWVLRKPS